MFRSDKICDASTVINTNVYTQIHYFIPMHSVQAMHVLIIIIIAYYIIGLKLMIWFVPFK